MLRIRIAETIADLPAAAAAELEKALETIAAMAEMLPSNDYRWDRLKDRTTGLLTAAVNGFRAYASIDYENAEVVVVAVKPERSIFRWPRPRSVRTLAPVTATPQ